MRQKIAPRLLIRGLLALFAALALPACSQIADEQEKVHLIIRNVNAWDAANGMREGVDVALSGDEIAAIGTSLSNDTAAEEIDGTGHYLIPGLWDAHVHLAYDEDVGHEIFFPLSLAHGVTSLRDTGGHLDKLTEARAAAGTPTTPDLYVSGPLLDGKRRIYDGLSTFFVDLSVGLGTPEEARAMVDQLADDGVQLVKAYEMLEPDVFAAIVEQAEARGIPVAAHVPLSMTVDNSELYRGIDLQHLRNLELACAADMVSLQEERRAMLDGGPEGVGASNNGGLRSAIHAAQRGPAIAMQDEAACDALIASFAENSVFQTPTAMINRLAYEQWFKDPAWVETFALLPPDLREKWTTRVANVPAMQVSDTGRAFGTWNREMTQRLAAAGVPIMAGTDAPIAYFTPGVGLHAELAGLVANGLTPAQALEAATLTPARWFGLESERGLIVEGMAADLVLLSANPLDEISHTRAVEAVAKDGVWHDRAELDAVLAGVRE